MIYVSAVTVNKILIILPTAMLKITSSTPFSSGKNGLSKNGTVLVVPYPFNKLSLQELTCASVQRQSSWGFSYLFISILNFNKNYLWKHKVAWRENKF